MTCEPGGQLQAFQVAALTSSGSNSRRIVLLWCCCDGVAIVHTPGLATSIGMSVSALAAIGVNLVRQVFPAVVVCPRCGGNLSIDLDTVCKGLWLSCQGCEATGNIVEFASHLWQTSPDQARSRLAATLPMVAASCLDRQLADAGLRAQTLHLFDVGTTRALLYDDGRLRALLSQRGLSPYSPNWQATLSALVYACEPQALRK